MRRFTHFLGLDWSGAKGARQKGIALAIADAQGGPPVLVHTDKPWSRQDILELIRNDMPRDTLIGMDLGIGLPFQDCGAYFPRHERSPKNARELWALIDQICADDPYLEASSFVDDLAFAPYFRRHGSREGTHFRCDDAPHGRGRFRATEHAQAAMGCKPYSNFNLVGAAQVGKSSLTGMRMLHQLGNAVSVWPVDPLPDNGPAAVEIYTGLISVEAGRSASRSKIRSYEELDAALTVLGSPKTRKTGAIDDHSSDALLAAAWLRAVAHKPLLWSPPAMSEELAQTEGWTFGAI